MAQPNISGLCWAVSLENEDAEQNEHKTRNKVPDAVTYWNESLASKADLWHKTKLE